jgi:hypothetical protein
MLGDQCLMISGQRSTGTITLLYDRAHRNQRGAVRPQTVELGSEQDDEGEDAQQYQGNDRGPHAGNQVRPVAR